MTAPVRSRTVVPPKTLSYARFVARQPILTGDEKIFGYELLFRDGIENCFRSNDQDAAARSTLDATLLMGLDELCDRRKAFVNFTRTSLLSDYAVLLPPQQAVIEILETVPPDDEVRSMCERLKQAGHLIALDDFAHDDPRRSMVDLADIIKVDVMSSSMEQQAGLVHDFGRHCRMLAEKVETREQFQATRKLGFVYFQGYFFCRPEVVTTRDIPGNRLNYVMMLQAVSRSELDMNEIERLIKSEAAICYRLLRYLNSSLFCLENEIHSVRHALNMLGERNVRRWVQLVAIIAAGQEKFSEVVFTALVRARFCELLAPHLRSDESELFLMGLMSLMDTILQMPMSQVLQSVPLDQSIKHVLLGQPSSLRLIYRLMLAQESGEWEAVADLARLLKLTKDEPGEVYWRSVQWAREVSGRT